MHLDSIQTPYQGGILLASLTPKYVCTCPKPGFRFPSVYVIIFVVFNDLMRGVVAHLFDISGFCFTITAKLSFHNPLIL